MRHVVHLTLAVHPGWQGQGILLAVLTHLIAWARACPVRPKNRASHARPSMAPAQELCNARWASRRWGVVERRVKVAPGHTLTMLQWSFFVK